MVLDYHGKKLRLDEVREAAGVDRNGSNARSLLDAGTWFGLRGRGVQVDDVESLRYLEPASILHWQFDHFVVFESFDERGALIVDPASGRRRVPPAELGRSFTGVAVTYRPADDFTPGGERSAAAGRYWKGILSQSGLLSRLVVISVFLQVLGLATPILTGLLVDRVVPRGDYHLLTVLGAGLAAIVVFQFLSSLIRAHLMLQLRTHLDAKVTLEFLDHLVGLPYSFFQQRSAGDLMMRLNSNATVREILTSTALSGVLDGVLVSLYLVLMFLTDSGLSLLVLALAALRIGLFLLARHRYRDLMTEMLETQARSRGYQVQMLSGMETLKAAGAEQRAVEHWSNLFVDELNVSLARGRLSAVVDSLLAALAMASPFVILAMGAARVLEGHLTLGTMLAFTALAVGFLGPLSTLISTALQLQQLGSYLERLSDVLETPGEQVRHDAVAAPPLRGGVTVEGVSLRYGPRAPMVVRDVWLDIAPGSLVALVGASGAGKSSLAALLLGLYPPTEGRVLYDGLDLRNLDLRSVRRQLGMVPQQPYLFGASIRSNIALADPSLPLHRVVEAAKLAHIHDDIVAMPMGYDTLLADRGESLSGGQRQRLALARALVRRPAVLVLDEATSHLDAVTERAVQNELARQRSTRIVIAHRLSTIREADLILVMDQGRLVEQGRHNELMARGGRYRELVAAQVQLDHSGAGRPAIEPHSGRFDGGIHVA
jgi:ABC-type bacteriocin/lantibiotic exporter with double-glycine peptidase domain